MAGPSRPSADYPLRRRYGATVTVALSTTSASSASLAQGEYLVSASAVWFFAHSSGPATTSDFRLSSGATIEVWSEGASSGSDVISGILASGTGTMYITQVL